MFKQVIKAFLNSPKILSYLIYDFLIYIYLKLYKYFSGWGIHLFVGEFGSGKTIAMCKKAYDLCIRYNDITILTNLKLVNFPKHTRILPINGIEDILNAPPCTIVMLDEIQIPFNSLDFMTGKKTVPKSLLEQICQCRKRNMLIFGTLQDYTDLDKSIRDITATVTKCQSYFTHPFSRVVLTDKYKAKHYELSQRNPLYESKAIISDMFIQNGVYRSLYDTSEFVENILEKNYLSDEEIIRNRGEVNVSIKPISKKEQRKIRSNLL